MKPTLQNLKRQQKLRQVLDAHKMRVFRLMSKMSQEVMLRGNRHDDSKYEDAEFPIYADMIDEFEKHPYGSKGYDAAKASIKSATDHHFKHNRHHPEYHPEGIDGMTLVDLLEMLADWKAATQNHPDNPGDLRNSIALETKKYKISPQLARILYNTAIDFEML